MFRPLLTSEQIAARLRASTRPGGRGVTRRWVFALIAREWPALAKVRGEHREGTR